MIITTHTIKALLATGDAVLKHSIGNNDRTSLRSNDFCRLLIKIREELKHE